MSRLNKPGHMKLSDLIDLYHHMQWADASVWRAVFASETARGDQKLTDYFYHLHLVQRAFLRAWRGEPRDAPFPTFDDAHSLMLWGRSYYDEVFKHLEKLSDQAISQRAVLPWAELVERQLGQTPAPINLSDMMLQVPLHSQYHRGQINARLRAVGGEPPTVDYIAWLWLGRPPADWNFPNE